MAATKPSRGQQRQGGGNARRQAAVQATPTRSGGNPQTPQTREGPRETREVPRGSREVPRRTRAAAQDGDLDSEIVTRRGFPLWLQLSTFALAIAGTCVSTYLTYAHFTQASLAGCAESGLVNCTKVTTSAQSYFLHIPVAVLGLAFYLFALAILSPWAWRSRRREIHLARVVSLIAGVAFVMYLLYAELFIIGNICLYCTSVHVITFILFMMVVSAVAVWGLNPAARKDSDANLVDA